MSSPQSRPTPQKSPKPATNFAPDLSFSDIINYESFMDALIAFMNETAFTILQVKQRSGLSPACVAPVKMNNEEREKKMNDIVANLSVKYKEEASILSNSTNVNNSGNATANNDNSFQPLATSSFMGSVPDSSQNHRSLARSLPETTFGGGREPSSQVEPFRRRRVPWWERNRTLPDPVSPRAIPDSRSMPDPAVSLMTTSGGRRDPSKQLKSCVRRKQQPTNYPRALQPDSRANDDWEHQNYANATANSGRSNNYSNRTSGACNERCTNDCSINSRQQYR